MVIRRGIVVTGKEGLGTWIQISIQLDRWGINTGGSGAKHRRISFDTIGMLDPRTGPTTTQNFTQIPTVKPTDTRMPASGTGWDHEPSPIASPLAPGFPLFGFPFLFFAAFLLFHLVSYFSTSWYVARVWRSPDSYDGQTVVDRGHETTKTM